MNKNHITLRIFICIFFICLCFCMKKFVEIKKEQQNKTEQNPNNLQIIPTNKPELDTLTAWVTIYHPTQKECEKTDNITFTGDTGHICGCAVSQRMLDYYINFYDSIIVPEGNLKGRYVVNDKAGKNIILVDEWRPVGDSVKGCYKTKIFIKTK